jgi:hypothetical protein
VKIQPIGGSGAWKFVHGLYRIAALEKYAGERRAGVFMD